MHLDVQRWPNASADHWGDHKWTAGSFQPRNLAFFWLALRTLTFWGFYMNHNKEAKVYLCGGVQKSAKENFVLSGLKCNVRHEGTWQDLYWSKDHRRLVCMRRAGCTHVRLRIDRIESKKFQPIMRKLIASVGHNTTIVVSDGARR